MNKYICTIIVASFTTIFRAGASENITDKWHWIWVQPGYPAGWTEYEGEGAPEFTDELFKMNIDVQKNNLNLRLRLTGKISGGRASASGVLLGSDGGTMNYYGDGECYTSEGLNTGDGKCIDIIALRNGPIFIGIYRDRSAAKSMQ